MNINKPSKARGIGSFFLGCMAVSLVWLIILPWMATWIPIQRHLQLLEDRRINASAMFYTELEERPR